jgi:hypothetical protein
MQSDHKQDPETGLIHHWPLGSPAKVGPDDDGRSIAKIVAFRAFPAGGRYELTWWRKGKNYFAWFPASDLEVVSSIVRTQVSFAIGQSIYRTNADEEYRGVVTSITLRREKAPLFGVSWPNGHESENYVIELSDEFAPSFGGR